MLDDEEEKPVELAVWREMAAARGSRRGRERRTHVQYITPPAASTLRPELSTDHVIKVRVHVGHAL